MVDKAWGISRGGQARVVVPCTMQVLWGPSSASLPPAHSDAAPPAHLVPLQAELLAVLQGGPRQVDEAGLHVVVEAGDLG